MKVVKTPSKKKSVHKGSKSVEKKKIKTEEKVKEKEEEEEEEDEDEEKPMNKSGSLECKVFVQGLPWSMNVDEVKGIFEKCGEMVKVELPILPNGKKSGTAIIEFENEDDASDAIDLTGTKIGPHQKRWLKVRPYQPPSSSSNTNKSSAPRQKPENCLEIFVGNLPWGITETEIRDEFRQYGEVHLVRFGKDPMGRRGYAHVEFYETESTDKAVKQGREKEGGICLHGRRIRVDYAEKR